jgi:hypothetical protein
MRPVPVVLRRIAFWPHWTVGGNRERGRQEGWAGGVRETGQCMWGNAGGAVKEQRGSHP